MLLFLSDEENEKEEVGFTRNLYTIVGAIAFLAIFLSGGAILFTTAIKDLLKIVKSQKINQEDKGGTILLTRYSHTRSFKI